ncbi:MAG: uvrD [Candidatus Saccharibacteria bacterium]|nr:uvrD [Candidatus Saccharibacteria bacterium]
MDFSKRYETLNAAQKQAVDHVDGPVMVIAGPGTGKTELLSIRVARIIQTTDTLPENILCLTFTDSGANAIRERLVGIIGKDAYKVAIHTFHSFGTEVINQNAQFFYEGAHFRPADDLSRYEIIHSIFEGLGHNNILNKKMNGDYTYLRESLKVISELKKSGLTSDELLEVLDANDGTIEKTEQLLAPIFASKISKTTADTISAHIDAIKSSSAAIALPGAVPLGNIIADSLEEAVSTATSDNSTKPVTAWRNKWMQKNERGDFVMKSRDRQVKLRAVSSIYEQYLARMQEAELYDFDDMILRVVHGMEIFDELRFNLQEKYQYIMVDEFQDTNMAQMRIVHNLTNNIAHGDTPNIMVVGDDDQAIYSFQGADISNIIDFRTNYPKTEIIALTDNYRSGESILEQARTIITQGSERLENHIDELNKNLAPKTKSGPGSVSLYEAATNSDERAFLIDSIQTAIKSGKNPSDIAVLTRKHREIEKLLPYFVRANIPVSYDRRDNVLDLPPIILVEQLARILIGLYLGQHQDVNALLPQLLAHPAWGIEPLSLWQLSLKAATNRSSWLDEMALEPTFVPLHAWLITTALSIPHTPLETILDIVIGKTRNSEIGYISPLYEYFFDEKLLNKNPDEYVRYLEALRVIRTKLRDYHPIEIPTLLTFIEFIDLHRSIGSGITSIHSFTPDADAVHLMTAHSSKGLEFDSVYITGAIDSVWGERVRSRSNLIGYPENLPLSPVGDTSDERLRLFYVAITRAKNNLSISYSLTDDSAKATARAAFLIDGDVNVEPISGDHTAKQIIEAVEVLWYEPLIQPTSASLKDLLASQLSHYQLSVTHLTNFLDITRGGPQTFLLQNLLRFPQAMSPAASYGSAIHQTLQRAHTYLASHGERQPVEDVLHNFETALESKHLAPNDYENYLQKGSDNLQVFLTEHYGTFNKNQKVELDFAGQHVIVGDAHLTGKLDLVDISAKTMIVSDYKTGKPSRSWVGKTDYEKIKLHKYKTQLMFYKLLVEHSRDWGSYKVESGVLQYVEPTITGDVIALDTGFSREEQERLVQLIGIVWQRIITLELPDISKYEQSLKGILAFEQDLIDNAI